MPRKRLISDKCRDGIQKFIDRRPHLPVPVNSRIISPGSQDFFLILKALIDSRIRNELKKKLSSLPARTIFPAQFISEFNNGVNNLLPEIFKKQRLFFPASRFGNIKRLLPSAAMNPVFTGIVLQIHHLIGLQVRKAGFDQPQHIFPAEIQPQNSQQRQEILPIAAHQNRLILFYVKRNPRRGQRHRQQRRKRILLTDLDRHLLPGNASPMPVNQRLTGMLAFQIRVSCIVHVNVGHIRHICAFQFSHRCFPDGDRVFPDYPGFVFPAIDSFTAEGTESIDVLLRIGNTGVHSRHDIRPLNDTGRVSALQPVFQCLHRIVGCLKDIAIRAFVIADQADDNLVSSRIVIGKRYCFHQVQNIMGNIIETVDQKLTVPNNPAPANHPDSGHPLSDRILKSFFKNLLISLPDQGDILQLRACAAAVRFILSQKPGSQSGTREFINLSGDLRSQGRLRRRIPVVCQFIPVMMQHPGNNHILPVPGNRLPIPAACQFPNLTDQ